ncbi:MAG: tetratricopeptide repeat protein, partial [Bacteroidales bacterium]|nr:tetratricopeptide repeat protein [Bacteroidales bacterium]
MIIKQVFKYLFTLLLFSIGITTISAEDQDVIDSLKKHNLSESNLKTIVDNDNEISFSFGAIDIDSSLFYSHKAMILAREINYTYGLALSHSYTARAMIEKDRFKNAIEEFNTSIDLFTELEDSANILDCYSGLTYVYSYGSAQMKSLNYSFKALNIAQELQDSLIISTISNNIGTIYTKLGNYDAAIIYYSQSMTIDEQLQRFGYLAISHSNVGILKLENHKIKEAATNYNKVLSLLPKINNPYTNSSLFLSLSSYYTELNNFDSAQYYIDLANTILTLHPYKHLQTKSLRKEAEMLFKQKKYLESISVFDKCLELSTSIGTSAYFPKVYKMKGEAYSHLNMYKKAYQFAQLAMSANDSLQNKKAATFL